ncbi:MAG: hypothetical protein KGI25_08295 [Thaumarchaeota archaeon]|nr:hypothetical protein [Nitrososphaerota archaeon]
MTLSNTWHSNKQVVLKRLGLSEIAPTWNQRLSKLPVPFLTKIKWYLDIHDKNTCVVGEAHGFDSHYANDCNKCDKFSLDLESQFMKNQFRELEDTKVQFVHHWNEQHRDVTYSFIGKRRMLRWYDSFLRVDDYIQTTK